MEKGDATSHVLARWADSGGPAEVTGGGGGFGSFAGTVKSSFLFEKKCCISLSLSRSPLSRGGVGGGWGGNWC